MRSPYCDWFCILILATLFGQADGQNLGRLTQQESKVENSESRTEGFLSPRESLKRLQLPDGFSKSLFAAEPDVRQPISAATDPRGRLWVCENYTYSEARINFDLSLNDRIVILSDTNNDGEFDERKVFLDQLKQLTSLEVGLGGVFVLCPPQLLFVPDRDRDDVPDGPPEVLLDGWDNDAVRHNIANGLMWGPDGWLYGRHGIMSTSFVGRPGATRSQRTAINCGIWRYHPIHKSFEVVAHGTTNPWGMDYDRNGNLFMINTVIGHLWHVVPGARFDRMYGSHFNPYTYETIPQTADHYHWNRSGGEAWSDTKKIGVTPATDRFGGGHAHCGLLLYADSTWPRQYHDSVFTCNLLGHRINNDRLESTELGFVGKHNPDFAHTSDTWFRGVEMVRSHDDGFYLLDWQDTGECHENDGVHRTSGRVYKINYRSSSRFPSVAPDLYSLPIEKLLDLVAADRWHSEKAIVILRERMHRSDQNKNQILSLLKNSDDRKPGIRFFKRTVAGDFGTAALFGEGGLQAELVRMSQQAAVDLDDAQREKWLGRLNMWRDEHLIKGSNSDDPQFIRELTSKPMAPVVRRQLAILLPLLSASRRLETAQALANYPKDKLDPIQSKLIWYGIEPVVVLRPELSVKVAVSSKLPLLSRLIARRLTEEIDDPRMATTIIELVSGADREVILAGILDGLRGRQRVQAPEKWSLATARFQTKSAKRILDQISIIFGDGQSLDELRKTAQNKSQDSRIRGMALLTLAEKRVDNLLDLLNRNLNDKDVRQYVIQAYVYCDDPGISSRIINLFPRLKPAGKTAAVNTLTSRASWGTDLLVAIRAGKIDRSHLSAWHARQLDNFGDTALSTLLSQVWGTVRKTAVEKQRELVALKQYLTSSQLADANLEAGKALFEKSCANCHVLFGKGSRVGPDLTGSNRRDLGYLLENIVDPGSSVAESYRTSIVELFDGRTLTGVILKQTPRVLEIQTAEKLLVLDRNDVQAIKQTSNSLMPEGLLRDLGDQQRRDLIGYLMQR